MCWLSCGFGADFGCRRVRFGVAVVIAMRLREMDCTNGAVVDTDPDSGGQRVARTRATVHVKEAAEPAHSDEIEYSDSGDCDGSEKPDEISDDSSNLGDEVPVATKLLTGRIRRKKVRSKRGDGDNVVGGKSRAKKAAPKDWILKYLQPNVSNVADRLDHSNAGNSSSIARASTHPSRQSEVGHKDPSPNEEEREQPPSVHLSSGGQPEGTSVVQDEGTGDADDEDFADFEVLAFTKTNDMPIGEKPEWKDQAQKAQKTPVAATDDWPHFSEESNLSSSGKVQPDDFEISPRKPLAENPQRDVEYLPERMPLQTKEKGQKENKALKKRRLSLSKDSRRQLSLKSILKAFPVQ